MRKKRIAYFFICTIILCFSFLNFPVYAEGAEETLATDIGSTSLCENNNDPTKNDILIDVVGPVALEFLGAFLGVLTALGLNSHANKKQYKELNKSLYNELLTLEKDLNKRLTNEQDYYRYLTPVWDINLASGNLSILTNKHIDKKYIEIYSKIQYAQELEREYIHSKLLENNNEDNFLNAYITTINNARIREAKEINQLIVELRKKEVK